MAVLEKYQEEFARNKWSVGIAEIFGSAIYYHPLLYTTFIRSHLYQIFYNILIQMIQITWSHGFGVLKIKNIVQHKGNNY